MVFLQELRHLKGALLLLVLLLALGLTLMACGPAVEPDPSDPADDVDPDDDDPDPAEPGEPVRVTVAQVQGPVSWDPPQDWGAQPEWIIQNAYDYLFIRSCDGTEWVPQLAKDWENIDDLTWRFYLEEGVKFHDGSELTAHDVKHLYRRILEGPQETYLVHNQYQFIDYMVVQDDYTIDFVTHQPHTLTMWQLSQANTGAGITSEAHFEAVGVEGYHREPMGTGPWMLKDWSRDEFALFEANPDYWRGAPQYDELMFRVIPEASTRVAELIAGDVDLVHQVNAQDYDRLQDMDGVRAEWHKSDRNWVLQPRSTVDDDHKDDPELNREYTTDDPRIRKAIELAVDKYVLRDIAGGIGEPFRGLLSHPPEEGHPDNYGPSANLYDPDRARELIAEAGYEPGEATLVFHSYEMHPYGDVSRVIEDMLEDVGFSVELHLLDQSTMITEIYRPRKSEELMIWAGIGIGNPYFGTFNMDKETFEARRSYPGGYPDNMEETLNTVFTSVDDYDAYIEAFQRLDMMVAEDRHTIGLFQESVLWGMKDRIEYTPRVPDADIMGYKIQVVE